MTTIHRCSLILAAISASMLCALPLMSAPFGGIESGDMIVRALNLAEFSVWGSVCLVAPLLVPCICVGYQSRAAKELELIGLVLIYAVCYTHSFMAAREWLMGISVSFITYHPMVIVYPLAFLLVWLMGRWCIGIQEVDADVTWYLEEEAFVA